MHLFCAWITCICVVIWFSARNGGVTTAGINNIIKKNRCVALHLPLKSIDLFLNWFVKTEQHLWIWRKCRHSAKKYLLNMKNKNSKTAASTWKGYKKNTGSQTAYCTKQSKAWFEERLHECWWRRILEFVWKWMNGEKFKISVSFSFKVLFLKQPILFSFLNNTVNTQISCVL
jgi:hypothetical protein